MRPCLFGLRALTKYLGNVCIHTFFFTPLSHHPVGRFVDVRLLGTRKTAQAGVSHFWRMHANDLDPRLCPIRILALLAAIYKGIRKSGPLFLRTSAYGAVLSEKPIVRS